jgi:hypothetical protein
LDIKQEVQPAGESNMNPLTAHTQQQGVTYTEHWDFAMGIAYRLLVSMIAFAIHAILPFISIEPRLDLEATAAFLEERTHWIETAKDRQHSHPEQGDARSKLAHV